MRAAFLGTPEFAVPCLAALREVADVALVITQPDKPQGRGLALSPTPVKAYALEHGLSVLQPPKARDGVLRAALLEAQVDLALVVAYGKILPLDVLEAPRLGCLNVHGSLLPRWRGAAPIQWAIVSGDKQTGVCLMQMDVGMDTGDVLARRVVEIGPDETGGELFVRLSGISAELVRAELPRFVRGELTPAPQPSDGVTHARMIDKTDGALDFSASAQAVHDRARGFYPWPGAFTTLEGKRMKIHRTRLLASTGKLGAPGRVLASASDGIVVACSEGAVRIEELQLDGKKRVSAQAFLAGHPLAPGATFS
ncbi:MAG: Methionyl-tRNA formyltransferase [Myxococcaceae bacterium]|nr:Methionyl-tRNA formyltransferase [Myxococcaceae bacterium]